MAVILGIPLCLGRNFVLLARLALDWNWLEPIGSEKRVRMGKHATENGSAKSIHSACNRKLPRINQPWGMAYVVVVTSFLGVKVCCTAYTSYWITHHSCNLNPIHKNQRACFLEVITLTFNYVAVSCSLRLASQHYNNTSITLTILQLHTYCGMHYMSNTLHYAHNAQLRIR